MKKRAFCCLLAAALCVGLLLPAQAAASQPNVSVQRVSATAGDEVSVDVVLTGNTVFSDLSIELDYDPTVLTLIRAEQKVTDLNYSASQQLTDRPYSMIWLSAEASACTFNGILATLTFLVSEDARSQDCTISVSFYKGRRGDYKDGVNVNYCIDNAQTQTPLGLTYTNGAVHVEALPDTEITVSLGEKQETLSARHKMTGQIYIASYSQTGQMLNVSIRDAAQSISASPAAGAAYVKIMWLDNLCPVCEAKQIVL